MLNVKPDMRAEESFPVVEKLITIINALPERDQAETLEAAIYAVDSLGRESGFLWLSTAEEHAVASAMKQLFCGPRSAHYGWRLYARYRQSGELNPLSITY